MGTQRFHKEVGFESGALKEIFGRLQRFSQIQYTRHAQLETIKDRYATIPVLKLVDIKPNDVFEYTKELGEITRFAIRIKNFDKGLDFCYSVSLDGNVITVWANTKEDSHQTLNVAQYVGV